MKKSITFLLILCSLLFMNLQAQKFYLLDSIPHTSVSLNPAGTILGGVHEENPYKSFLWYFGSSGFTWFSDDNYEITDITYGDILVGSYKNPNVLADLKNESGTIENVPVRMVGICFNVSSKEIFPLGLGEFQPEDLVYVTDGSYANHMGDMMDVGGYLKVDGKDIPCLWKFNPDADWKVIVPENWDFINLLPEKAVQGQVLKVSSSGDYAIGYIQDENQVEKPVLWDIKNETYRIPGENLYPDLSGRAYKFNRSEEYIVFTISPNKAILYNLRNDTYTPIDDFGDSPASVQIAGIAHGGLVFGTYEYLNATGARSTRSFFFKEDIGLIDFEYFSSYITDDITLPSGISFSHKDGMYYKLVDITIDGKVVMGVIGNPHNGEELKTFVLSSNKDVFQILFGPPLNVDGFVERGNTAVLTWEAPETNFAPVISYNIYRDMNTLIGNVDNETFTYTDTEPEKGHRIYRIGAVYEVHESVGNLVRLIIGDEIIDLNLPLNLDAKVENINKVILTWEAPEPIENHPVTGYNIYRDDVFIDEVDNNTFTFTDTDVQSGERKYAVSAVYDAGESDKTEPVTVTIADIIPFLNPPLNFDADIENRNTVILTWEAPEPIENHPVTGYNIYRDEVRITDVNSETFTYTDRNVEKGERKYVISAVYEAGESDRNTQFIIVTIEGATPVLNPPLNLGAKVEDKNKVVLTWEAPESIEDNPVTRYNIYRDNVHIDDVDDKTFTYTDTEVEKGERKYAVSALYGEEESEKTDEVTVTIEYGGTSLSNMNEDAISIYPNPANDVLNIKGKFNKAILYNMDGKVMMETIHHEMYVAHLPDGVYILEIATDKGTSRQKVIIRK